MNPLFLALVNGLACTVIAIAVTYKLTMRADDLTCLERVGMGLAAAGALLSIGPILDSTSPFRDWSEVLMRLGMALYFTGRLVRGYWFYDRTNRRDRGGIIR